MTKTVLISQSDYIPWRGYFDLIASADIFIILDDVQYTRQDWRNRNRVKTANGLAWLTIPIVASYPQRINETAIASSGWAVKHWKTLSQSYAKTPHFKEIASWLEPLYQQAANVRLISEVNRLFMQNICDYLGIITEFRSSTDLFPQETLDGFDKNQRVLQLCKAVGGNRYISGPLAKDYMDMARFESAEISIDFADYSDYPAYPQIHGEFTPYVSILDTLFNTGKKAGDYTIGFAV